MSHWSVRPGLSTSAEAALLTQLFNLGTTTTGFAIAKNADGTFSNVQPTAAFPITTKGDLLVYTTLATRLGVGSDGQVLTADAASAAGVKWAAVAAGAIVIGTSTITSGTNGRILYDNSGVVGEMTTTGSGTVVALATSPVFVTPTLGVAGATAIGVNKSASATIALEVFADGTTYTQGVRVQADASTRLGFSSYVTADAQVRFTFRADGLLGWGDGTNTTDTNLYRSAAKLLATDSAFLINPAATIASASGAVLDDLRIAANTTTVTGTTAITNVKGFNKVSIYTPTITDASSVTITNAASLYIDAAPVAAGSVTITNAFALWVAAGAVKFGGTLTVTGHVTLEGVTSTGATGTNLLVFATSPTLTTPVLGVATATSINSLTITTSTGTLTITNLKTLTVSNSITLAGTDTKSLTLTNSLTVTTNDGTLAFGAASKTLTINNSITFAGTDSTTMTFPAASATIAGLGTTQTFTGINTFTPTARSSGSASYFTINAPADTGISTTAESIGINHVGATRTWVDGTTATQREYLFQAPTYNKTTTSAVFTKAATLAISAAPTAGTGVTITNAYALWVQAGNAQFDGGATATNVIYPNNAIAASSNAATVPVTSRINTVTNNSAATLTITLTTTGAVDRQLCEVLILDSSAVAQTITWVNTENSGVTAPVTSNGSTTLPLSVLFQYNLATTKWRCIASA